MHLLGMTNAPRTRGRKANGYRPVRNHLTCKTWLWTPVNTVLEAVSRA